MITLRDLDGRIQACCEFWIVDQEGNRDPHGSYVWVHQLEISAGVPGHEILEMVIREIAEACPHALGAYWQRQKTGERPHLFTRTRLLEEVVG